MGNNRVHTCVAISRGHFFVYNLIVLVISIDSIIVLVIRILHRNPLHHKTLSYCSICHGRGQAFPSLPNLHIHHTLFRYLGTISKMPSSQMRTLELSTLKLNY